MNKIATFVFVCRLAQAARMSAVWVCVSSALCAFGAERGYAAPAQGFEAEVAANPANCVGIFRRYEFGAVVDTPPPAGYVPFYISHYGRHGCRYLTKESQFAALDSMEKASGADALTEKGLELLKCLRRIKAVHSGMMGSLSARGADEHRRISRRMHDRFPQVFSAKGAVQCQSSTYPRCLTSMANFACELKGLEPQLEMSFATGDRYMPVILNRVKGKEFDANGSEAAERRLLESVFDPGPMLARLFRDASSAASFMEDPCAFYQSLFFMIAVCSTLDAELEGLEIYDKFTVGELCALSRAMNGRWFFRMGNATEIGSANMARADKLAKDIASRAEGAMGGNGVVADLRFGHDAGLWPLAGYLGLEGVGDSVPFSKVCDHDVLWRCMTMAANIQFAFYRNDVGDVLVKVLFNERETAVRGLEPVAGPYYRWPDLKALLTRR